MISPSFPNRTFPASYLFFILFATVCVLPFFIISYFTNPSHDDYIFAVKVHSQGFFHSQADWYTQWTGRYFSSFLASAGPLTFYSMGAYKAVPVILLLLFLHATYQLLREAFGQSFNTIEKLFIAAGFLVLYLMHMPSVVQGIYWLMGAITYQLGNILFLYLAWVIIKLHKSPSLKLKMLSVFLVFAIPGLNENSLLLQNEFLFFVAISIFIREKKISSFFIVLFLLSLCFSAAEILAPGNFIRGEKVNSPDKYNLLFSLPLALNDVLTLSADILSSPSFILALVTGILFFSRRNITIAKFLDIPLYAAIPVCFIAMLISVLFNYFVTADPPADRVLNVSVFIFLCSFFYVFVLICKSISARAILKMSRERYRIVMYSLLFLFTGSVLLGHNNVSLCLEDLFSGKAYLYDRNCTERYNVLESAPSGNEISLQTLQAFPKTIVFQDLAGDTHNEAFYWTTIMGQYFNKLILTVDYRPPCYAEEYFYTLDNDSNAHFSTLNSLVNEKSFSGSTSSLLRGPDSYSITFSKKVKDLSFYTDKDITNITTEMTLYSDTVYDAVMVISVLNPRTGETVLWTGKPVSNRDYPVHQWKTFTFISPITESRYLKPHYEVLVYLWNRSPASVYMDDLRVLFY